MLFRSVVRQADAFRSVVHDGALVPAGMPIFAELTDEQLADLRQFLRARAVQAAERDRQATMAMPIWDSKLRPKSLGKIAGAHSKSAANPTHPQA